MDSAMEAAAVALSWALGDCEIADEAAKDAVTAYLAAKEAEGWVLVPVEPTEAMIKAGWLEISCAHPAQSDMPRGVECDAYRAMLAARPQNERETGSA